MHRRGIPGLTLAEFVAAAWETLEPATPLQWNWHIDAVCAHLEALILDEGPDGHAPQNLLINVPPGTMKSLIFSVCLPAWAWLFRPSWRAIYASGTPSVVTRDSLKCRNLITSDWYQETFAPAWKIAADQNEKQNFANTAGGFRKGVGAGGSVTGERADFLGVDDPNDAKEIASKAHRTAINENWWSAAFHNRIADPSKSKRALIMQRLHEEDLAGYVVEKEKGEWAHLCLPMEYEAQKGKEKDDRPGDRVTWIGFTDPRTTDGELLFPQRFTVPYLNGERKTLGSAGYAGQMQQRPSPALGNKFLRSWWRFWSPTGDARSRPKGCCEVPPRRLNPSIDQFDEIVGSWDCSFKNTDGSDFVVGIVVGRIGADKYVLAHDRARRGLADTQRAIRQMHKDWPLAFEILVEDKANGSAVVETLSGEIAGVIAVDPKGGKESRAAAIEPQVEAGNVYLPEGAEWLDAWVEEFAAFPTGKHDDQVDALSQALVKMLEDSDVVTARALLGMRR